MTVRHQWVSFRREVPETFENTELANRRSRDEEHTLSYSKI